MSVEKYASDPTTRRGSMAAGDDAAGVDALETQPLELAAVLLEVPPRHAVLGADHDGVGAEQRREPRRQRGQAVRLDAEKDDIGRADRREVVGDLRPHLEVAVRRW